MDRDESPMTLSVPGAAKRLGISRAFAYELVSRAELPSLRGGRRVVILRNSLQRLVDDADRSVG